jgi:hypothetical protein
MLLAQDDCVCAPLEPKLGERVSDGCTPDRNEVLARGGGVDLERLDADDDGVVVCDVDGLDSVVRLCEAV